MNYSWHPTQNYNFCRQPTMNFNWCEQKGSHPVWPRDHFGPTLTSARKYFGPKQLRPGNTSAREYFGPVNTSARRILRPGNTLARQTLAQHTSARKPNFQKCHFSSFWAFNRLWGCLRVKLKPQLPTLPGLTKNWKILPGKAKNQSHPNKIPVMQYIISKDTKNVIIIKKNYLGAGVVAKMKILDFNES